MRIIAQSSLWRRGVEFLIADGKHRAKLVFEEVEEGLISDATFALNIDEAQGLMDDLWNCGLRPTEGSGSAGSLRATEKHLEDMRKIAFMGLEEKA